MEVNTPPLLSSSINIFIEMSNFHELLSDLVTFKFEMGEGGVRQLILMPTACSPSLNV